MKKRVLAFLLILFVSLVLTIQPSVHANGEIIIDSMTTAGAYYYITAVHPGPAGAVVSATGEAFNQSHAGDYLLTKASFYIRKYGSPVGNLTARLYDVTGVYGSSMTPNVTDTPYFQESAKVSMAGLDIAFSWVNFTFSSSYVMPFNHTYCIIMLAKEATTLNSSNYIMYYFATPSGSTGNIAQWYSAAWLPNAAYDCTFIVYGQPYTLTALNLYGSASFHFQNGPTSALFEGYNTGDDDTGCMYSWYWKAQSFTVGTATHNVSSIKLKLWRGGTPGIITVGVRAANVTDGTPVFGDLTSGTIDGDTLNPIEPGQWYTILVTSYSLTANTKYNIVVRAPAAPGSSYAYWRCDGSSPAYAGGNESRSSDSGVTWTSYATRDFMFEVCGPSASSRAWTVDRYGSAAETFTVLGPVSLNIFGAAAQTFATASQNVWNWLLTARADSWFSAYGTGKGWWFIPPVVTPTRDPLIYVAIGFGLVALGIAVDFKRRKKR